MTSKDCNCSPPEPFLNETAINWISPLASGAYSMESTDTESSIVSHQTLQRDYTEGEEARGGDECLSLFTTHRVDFTLVGSSSPSQYLIGVKAVGDDVIFSVKSKINSEEIILGYYDVKANTIGSAQLDVELQLLDTILQGNVIPKVQIACLESHPEIKFKTLVYVKSFGVTNYVDTLNQSWLKK